MKSASRIFGFLLIISALLYSCKSSEEATESAPPPPVEEPEAQTESTGETEAPKLVMDTVRETTEGERLPMVNGSESANDSNITNGASSAPTEGSGSFRVQVDATMGNVFKPKYKGCNKLYFEEGPGGSKVYVGKNLDRAQAEQLRDEYKLRGFEDAFVVPMSGSGAQASDKFEGEGSSQTLTADAGAVFLVQLIAYRDANPPKKLKKVNFFQILGFNDGFKRIYSGTYATVEEAKAGQEMFKKMGFKDCYVVPFEGYKNKLNGLVGEPIQP